MFIVIVTFEELKHNGILVPIGPFTSRGSADQWASRFNEITDKDANTFGLGRFRAASGEINPPREDISGVVEELKANLTALPNFR